MEEQITDEKLGLEEGPSEVKLDMNLLETEGDEKGEEVRMTFTREEYLMKEDQLEQAQAQLEATQAKMQELQNEVVRLQDNLKNRSRQADASSCNEARLLCLD